MISLRMSWDVVCFSETRAKKMDRILSGGHRLVCEYGGEGATGVAILIHRRWVKYTREVHLIHDRLIAIDIKLKERTIRIISIYVPHLGYGWHPFQGIFEDLSHLLSEV